MKMRYFSILLALCMALSLLPVSALAAEDGNDGDVAVEEEDLFYQYMLQLAREQESPSLMQTVDTAGSKLEGNTKILYDELSKEIKAIAKNGGSTVIYVPFTAFGIPEGYSWSYSYWGGMGAGWDEALGGLRQFISNSIDFTAVIHALLADFPYELYWYDKTAGFSYGDSYGYSGDGKNISLSTQNPWFKVSLRVANEYMGSDSYSVATGKITSYKVEQAVTTANAIVGSNSLLSDYQKLLAYKNWICDEVSYNYEAAGNSSTPYGNPWQLVWVFDGDPDTKVVCEGYSKAFKFLCDLSDFSGNTQCYLAIGDMANNPESSADYGAHMWNIVTLEGGNYLVDVTNCDSGFNLFLRGVTVHNNTGTLFYVEHNAQNILFYQYNTNQMPWDENILTLSATDYEPAPEPVDDAALDGGFRQDGVLVASVTAPAESLVIAACYDETGKLAAVGVRSIPEPANNEAFIFHEIIRENGCTYKLMLVNAGTYAPLCEALKDCDFTAD